MAQKSKDQNQHQGKSERGQQAKGRQQERGGQQQQGGKINLNRASRDDLMQIEGIGPTLADIIIKYRDEHGGFKNIDELDQVPGLAETRVDKVKERVSV